MNAHYFFYGDTEINYLKKQDTILGKKIDEIGVIQRSVNPNIFESLIHSITGQQISSKAHANVWNRLLDICSPFNPQSLFETSVETIQSCGITMRKAGYIKGIAEAVVSGDLDLKALETMTDSDVINVLTQYKGVGVWTAEMLLIFSLQRPNILSFGDLAIKRALCMLYKHETITRSLFNDYKNRYDPYASVASLYLWEISKQ